MRKALAVLVLISVIIGAIAFAQRSTAQQPRPQGDGAERPQSDSLAYGVGFYLGDEVRTGLETDGIKANLDLVVRGFTDGLQRREPMMSQAEMDRVLVAVHEEMQRRMVARLLKEDPEFRKLHDENLARSKAFIAEYAKQPDVKKLANGVLYRVLKSGQGASPAATDTVVVTYVGKLANGETFDAAEERELHLPGLRRGASEVLQQMRIGDKWEVAFPPEAAFGAAGDPPRIGPQEAMIITAELHAIK